MYIIVIGLSGKISQHLIEKRASENPGLKTSLWLKKEKGEKGKKISSICEAYIKFEGEIKSISTCKKSRLMVIVEKSWFH